MRTLLSICLFFLLAVPVGGQDKALGIRPILGIQTETLPTGEEGLRVDAVMPASIAERIGIEAGDVVLALNERPLRAIGDLRSALQDLRRGDRLAVRYRRGTQVVEKEDRLADVPVLASYEIVEGKGIPGVVQLGDPRETVEKTLGPAPGVMERDGSVILGYPAMGMTLQLLQGGDKMRVAVIRVQYPFVGRTRRGVLTTGPRDAIAAAYKGVPVQPLGQSGDLYPSLGIRFVSVGGFIQEVYVLPPAR
jgi:membrane-associated protease RseP (regulator of RpoE activity)